MLAQNRVQAARENAGDAMPRTAPRAMSSRARRRALFTFSPRTVSAPNPVKGQALTTIIIYQNRRRCSTTELGVTASVARLYASPETGEATETSTAWPRRVVANGRVRQSGSVSATRFDNILKRTRPRQRAKGEGGMQGRVVRGREMYSGGRRAGVAGGVAVQVARPAQRARHARGPQVWCGQGVFWLVGPAPAHRGAGTSASRNRSCVRGQGGGWYGGRRAEAAWRAYARTRVVTEARVRFKRYVVVQRCAIQMMGVGGSGRATDNGSVGGQTSQTGRSATGGWGTMAPNNTECGRDSGLTAVGSRVATL